MIAASVKQLVPLGLRCVARGGHLSLFAGLPKGSLLEKFDINPLHYDELHWHGANSSARESYLAAGRMLEEWKGFDFSKLVTNKFALADFNEAVAVQGNPDSGCLKVVIVP